MYTCSKCGKEYKKKFWYDKHNKKCNVKKERKYIEELAIPDKKILNNKNRQKSGIRIVFNRDEFIEVLQLSMGSVAWIAKVYDVSHKVIKKYIVNDEELLSIYEDQFNVTYDKAYTNILEKIKEGDIRLSVWFLSTFKHSLFKNELIINNNTNNTQNIINVVSNDEEVKKEIDKL